MEFEEVILYIIRYCLPIFIFLSLLGNCLSVCVLFCTKLRYSSSSIYLGALAISDIGVLVTIFLNWLHVMEIRINNAMLDFCLAYCLFYLQLLFAFLSMWIVVAFTIERYVTTKWPLLHRSWCTVERAKIVITSLAGSAILYPFPLIIVIFCYLYGGKNIHYLYWCRIMIIINAVIMFMLPLIMITIFNILIIYNIYKQNQVRKNLILKFDTSYEKTKISDSETSQIMITKMLVIISSIFICLNSPIQVCMFFIFYTTVSQVQFEFYYYQNIFNILKRNIKCLNAALSHLLYIYTYVQHTIFLQN